MTRQLTNLARFVLVLLLAACGANTGKENQGSPNNAAFDLPAYMRTGYETYHETGAVARPANAVDVYIVYAPESQQYMPRIIQKFNQLSAQGTNPLTNQPYTAAEKPVFVAGQPPTSGSSGSVAQGIINAFIAPNNEQIYHPTIFQPSVSHWLGLVNFNTGKQVFDLANIQPTALTPVIIGMWESRVEAIKQKTGSDDIGWDDLIDVLNSPNGWCDYNIPDCRRAVYYGHTDPNISSTGLSTTIAEFYACARKNGFNERLLSLAAINSDAVQDCVRGIENLVKHYSSRTEDFLQYVSRGPDYLDFLALEETDLICLNLGAQQGDETCTKPQEKLVAIYPKEGTFWDDHPFAVVNGDWVTAEQKEAANLFTAYVLLPENQKLIMAEGFRPANTSVPLEFPFVTENGVDTSKPTTILDLPQPEVIVGIQQSWGLVKKRADVILIIDTSGSMEEEGKIEQAKIAAHAFLAEMDSSNRVGLVTFSDSVIEQVPLGNYESVKANIASRIDSLRADGGTAMFDALATVIEDMNAEADTDRIRAVVLLSDGADTASSLAVNDVLRAVESSRGAVNPVLVVPIGYGSNADISTLTSIARASSTNVQSGDANNITRVLEIISSYF